MAASSPRLTIAGAVRLLRARRLSPIELIDSTLDRIDRLNPLLNALLTVTADEARKAARKAERRLASRASRPPLLGIPISIKDLILTRDAATTMGSRILPEGIPAGMDAPVVARLRRAGAIVIGKANLHEVAFGVTTVNEHFGPARNPWSTDRVAGGSSGGSAVAVAAGLGLGSVGTDTRGSIRIPAACCGVVGLKPTFGAVSCDGVFPLAATLDHVGPIARTVEDVALLFESMVTSRASARRARGALSRRLRRPRIAVSEFLLRDVDDEIGRAIEVAIRTLEKLGARISSVELPTLEESLEASRVIVGAEALSYHDQFLRDNPGGYGPLVRSRLETGYQLTALQLVRAEEARLRLAAEYQALFREVDCLVGAVLPVLAPLIGTLTVGPAGRERSLAEAFCHYNAPQNLTGAPALALPCGRSRSGLPIAMQLVSDLGREDTLLSLGMVYQRLTHWHEVDPPL